jgi:predicted DNA-binding protein
METTLINFNVPRGIRQRFDDVCRSSGRTRTSVLVEMMEHYIMSQGKNLATRNEEFEKVDQTLEKSRRIMGFKEFIAEQSAKDGSTVQRRSKSNLDLPDPMFTDGREDW